MSDNLLKIYHTINNIKYTGVSFDDRLEIYQNEDIETAILIYESDITFMLLMREYLIINNNIDLLKKYKHKLNNTHIIHNKYITSILKYRKYIDYKNLNVEYDTIIYALENIYNMKTDNDIISLIIVGKFYKSYEVISEIFTNKNIAKRFNIVQKYGKECITILEIIRIETDIFTQKQKIKMIRGLCMQCK